jgi:hypothetical protein
MQHRDDGFVLLAVLSLMLLLVGMTTLALMANVRLLRDNQVRAHALQERADREFATPATAAAEQSTDVPESPRQDGPAAP